MSEVTTFLFRAIGKASIGRLLALVAIMASAGCDSKISSKLVATKIIVPPEQGSEIKRDGVTVSVQPGTFSDPAEMDVEVAGRSIKISTVTATGAKVVSANVLKEVSFCAVVDPSFDRNKVYVLVEISEDQTGRSEQIPNSAIEFSDVNDQVRACWQSKYVNASFWLTMDRSRTTALKLTDPNCIDPDLSRLPNDEVLTLCDGSVANGSLDLDNLLAENVKSGVVVGGVLGSVVPTPNRCTSDGSVGCVTTTSFPAADKKTITANAAKIRDSVTIAGVAGTLADCADGGSGCVAVGPFQAAATVAGSASKILSGQTVAGISGNVALPAAGKVLTGIQFGISGTGQTGTLSLPVASNVLTGSGTYGDPGAAVTPSYSSDYPAVSNVLSTDTVNGVAGTLTLPAVGDVNSGVSYGVAGTGSTGTLTLPSAANVKSGTGTYGNPGSAITPTYSPDFPGVANVYSDTVDGVAGTLTLPVVGDVYSGTAYGVGGNGSTGTLTLAGAANVRTGNGAFGRSGNSVTPSLTDCSTDGGTSCVAVPAFKAADMTNVVAANIKNAVTIAAVTGTMVAAPADCAADGATSCVAVTNFPAVDKVNNITANAAKIRDSVTIAGVAGTLADCADGGSGCVAVGPLQAAATVAGSADKILSGQAVAGISGNVTLPAVGKVLSGIQFGISGTGQTGTLSLPVASNVLTGSGTYGDPGAAVTPSYSPDYPAVSNVLSTDTVNSVAGTLTLPAVGDVNSGVSYGVAGTGSTGTLTLPAAGNVLTGSGAFGNPALSPITPTLTLPSAANVKSGTGTYGNPGSAITPTYSPDFPAVANVYNDTVDDVSGTLTLPTVGNVYTGTVYGVAGTGSTGTLTVPTAANVRTGNGNFGQGGTAVTPTLADCSADGGTGCVAVAGFKAADMTNVVAGKIKSGVTIAGVAGDYPSVTNPLAGADGTADLVLATFDAKIKAATDFEWFDSAGSRYVNSGDADIVDSNILTTANIFGMQGSVAAPMTPDAWDIRVGQTINGVTGKLKVACRNSASTAVFDAGEFKNATADSTTDFFTVTSHGYADNDTIGITALAHPTGMAGSITYYVRFSTANTFQLATTSGGAAINFTTNGFDIVVYKLGGGVLDIWDTVDDYNNWGPVFTAADMPATWSSDNFCGGAGTASSSAVWTDTTSDGACDSAGDECRFKDKISGLEWSELQSSAAAWGTAMMTCGNLSFGGAGAWRLPTQKELMAAYEHGIYTVPNPDWLAEWGGFWSSSTESEATTYAWLVELFAGRTAAYGKTNSLNVLCVR